MKNRLLSLLPLFAVSLLLVCSTGYAHNFERINAEDKMNWATKRADFMPIDRIKPSPPPRKGHPGLEYLVVLPNKWAETQELRVCFYGGTDELRKKILNIAKTWIDHTNLRLSANSLAGLTCRNKDDSEIRIGFDEPGHWSYIGNDSINEYLISNNLSSLNLSKFDKNPPPEPRFTGIVLHEWGHALAIHHEHQSPSGGCETEYNWPLLYKYYETNYGWNQAKVDNNLKPLMADRSAYDWSPKLDQESIMIYASNPEFLINGDKSKCYFHANNHLSTADIEGIERSYPKDNANSALKFQVKTIPILLEDQPEGNLRKALQVQHDLAEKQLNIK